MKTSILREKSFSFAIRIIRLVQKLRRDHKEYVLSEQIMGSGTSPGAMLHEAEFAQSKKDFIHKMGIALKEMNETLYFLHLLFKTDYIDEAECISLLAEGREIKAMLIASIRTAKGNLKKGESIDP